MNNIYNSDKYQTVSSSKWCAFYKKEIKQDCVCDPTCLATVFQHPPQQADFDEVKGCSGVGEGARSSNTMGRRAAGQGPPGFSSLVENGHSRSSGERHVGHQGPWVPLILPWVPTVLPASASLKKPTSVPVGIHSSDILTRERVRDSFSVFFPKNHSISSDQFLPKW